MECDICSKRPSANLPFHCQACARSALYSLRIDHVKRLLEKETLGRQVKAIVYGPRHTPPKGAISSEPPLQNAQSVQKFELERSLAETAASQERIEQISRQADILKERIENYKKEVADRKAAAAVHRTATDTARATLKSRQVGSIEALKKSIKKTSHRHDVLYSQVTSSREYLCKEAASLAGLRRHDHDSVEGTPGQYYTIGGTEIVDLRDLNNASPQRVNTSLTNCARLLTLTCQYLQVRLPAEIILPLRDRPLAVLTPSSSYLAHSGDHPGKPLASRPSNASPSASYSLEQHGLRAVHLDRPLPLLAKDNPAAYAILLEGMTLLAWDIAWLCRTQGLPIASEHWSDVCAIGRNLYLLLLPPPRPPPTKPTPTKTTATHTAKPVLLLDKPATSSLRPHNPEISPAPPPVTSTLGILSHGTAHAYLLSAAPFAIYAFDVSARWKFASHLRVVDKLKGHLLAEMSGQEWEMLNESEYYGAAESVRRVQRGGALDGGGDAAGVDGGAVAAEVWDGGKAEKGVQNEDGKARGTSGWTKLKSRGLS